MLVALDEATKESANCPNCNCMVDPVITLLIYSHVFRAYSLSRDFLPFINVS